MIIVIHWTKEIRLKSTFNQLSVWQSHTQPVKKIGKEFDYLWLFFKFYKNKKQHYDITHMEVC